MLLAALLVAGTTALPAKYHTTEQLNFELDSLSTSCSFISLREASASPLIKEIDINKGAGKKYRGT